MIYLIENIFSHLIIYSDTGRESLLIEGRVPELVRLMFRSVKLGSCGGYSCIKDNIRCCENDAINRYNNFIKQKKDLKK